MENTKIVASHWRNSVFQIVHFLAGKCHTPDEAYRVLCQLHEERDISLKNAEATVLRQKAKRIRAERELESEDEVIRLEAQATIKEMEAFEDQSEACVMEAAYERDFIEKLIAKIEPHRVFAHLPTHEAHQAAQYEEWKLELIWRAENYLLTSGMIPPDHFETMRLHPAFEESILPAIQILVDQRQKGEIPKITQKKMVLSDALLEYTPNLSTI
jgi:hypothetical protein